MSKQKYPQAATISSTGEKRKTHVIATKKNGYSQNKAHAKQDRKRHEAYARQDKYDGMTIAEKFSTLIENGSAKQRKKLQKQLEVAVTKRIPYTESTGDVKPTKKKSVKKL